MKQKDIIVIILVVFLTSVISIIVSNMFFTGENNRKTKAEVVEAINADFNLPDARYFNSRAENPTRIIRVGDTKNPTPFNANQ